MTLFAFQTALFVRKDSPVRSISELKGRRVPSGWAQQTGVQQLMLATLATAGLKYEDVVSLPVVNVVRAADDFKAGKLDVFYFAVKAVHPNKKDLAAGHPNFNRYDPDNTGKPQPTLPHHPGAIKYFKEAGIWRG